MIEILNSIWNVIWKSIVNIGIGMTEANFSFLILVLAIMQYKEMRNNRKR